MKCRYLWLAVALISFAACEDDKLDEIKTSGDESLNGWIYDIMAENYLWNDEIKSYSNYDSSADAETFFYSLTSDNEWKTTASGSSRCYSYMEASTKAISYNGYSYGMQLLFYRLSSTNTNCIARVLYVVPDSPAAKAGIERGMWIMKVGGKRITSDTYNSLAYGSEITVSVFTGNFTSASNADLRSASYTIASAVKLEESPILEAHVQTFGERKVGYFCYTSFETGPDGFEDKTYDNQMKSVFSQFKNKGITDLILDLRYNGGGYVSCAQILASLIAPQSCLGSKVFCKLSYNDNRSENNTSLKFLSSCSSSNVDMSKVYILTTANTASASEAVINGLSASGICEVVLIGTTTEGKNLGSEAFENSSYSLILHPITAHICNGDNFGNYAQGLTPADEYYYDELSSDATLGVYPFLGELGTVNDPQALLALEDMNLVSSSERRSKVSEMSETETPNLIPVYSTLSKKIKDSVLIK